MHRLTATDTPMVRYTRTIFPSYAPSSFDNHYYRAQYAKRLYNSVARPESLIPKNEKYIMRKDRAGEVLDRVALYQVSLALGHSRIDVVPLNYLY